MSPCVGPLDDNIRLEGRIADVHAPLSPELWNLGARLPLGPNVGEFRGTGYPALGPAQDFSRLGVNQPGLAFLKAGPDVVTRPVDLGGGSVSRLDKA